MTSTAVAINPLPSDCRTDIGLVLVVGTQHLNIEAMVAEVLYCLLHADNGGEAGGVAVGAGLIIQHADADFRPA